MKQISNLSFFCLFVTSAAFAAPEAPLTETSIPDKSEIRDTSVVTKLPEETVAPVIPQTAAAPVDTQTGPVISVPPAVTGPVTAQATTDASAAPVSVARDAAPTVISDISYLASYHLSPGDGLKISVWKEEGLQEQDYLVTPDGAIIFPLVGTVMAAGKTISELRDVLATKLADYISDPSVTVKLLSNQGNSIFVIGKVSRPGQYSTSRKIDVMQALSLAGGLSIYADEDSISILRRTGNQTKVFPFDYTNVIKGADLEQNILLEPGDTVTVP